MKKIYIVKLSLFLFLFSFQMGVVAQKIGPNYIAFEAEDTESDLGLWKLRTPGDQYYSNPSSGMAPINNTHLEFMGNNEGSGPATSPLEYKFICPKTGSYKLGGRLFQRLEGAENDKCNDVYVKMSGNFTSGDSGVSDEQLRKDYKFVGRGVNRWGAMYKIEIDHAFPKAIYNFIKGEEYILTVSGRSQRCSVDYWLLYETSIPINIGANIDLAANNDEKYLPTDTNLSIEKSKRDIQIKLYPNPVSSITTIKYTENSILSIYDLNGTKVFTKAILSDDEIDLSGLSSGVYFFKVKTANGESVKKVIKK